MHDQGLLNLVWSEALVGGMVASGVVTAVISPGARSTPLVLACERAPQIETRVINDERSAAFFALGIAKQNRLPTLLVGTSGSAASHWYPAVIEAYHAGIPLLLLSADRPPELHDWGFNQTTDQQRLFGVHVKAFHDPGPPVAGVPPAFMRTLGRKAVHQALSLTSGPVHINLPFREPLAPDQLPAPPASSPRDPMVERCTPVSTNDLTRVIGLTAGTSGAIVCGPTAPDPGFAPAVTDLARRLEAPIFADPLSGLRFGTHDKTRVVSRYDTFLRNAAPEGAHRPRWILHFGATPVSKTLNEYVKDSGARTLLISPQDRWQDSTHRTEAIISSDSTLLCKALAEQGASLADSSPLLEELLARDRSIDRQCSEHSLPAEAFVIQRILELIPTNSVLFCGNSLPIRQFDTWSGIGEKSLQTAGNRGVSGIDGNLSTLHGMSSAQAGTVIGLIGDQAFFHDVGGLLLSREASAIVIVFNNRGGRIFSQMPLARLPAFEKYWTAPVNLAIEQAARLYECPFRRAACVEEFVSALTALLESAEGGVLEVVIDPEESVAGHRDFVERSKAY